MITSEDLIAALPHVLASSEDLDQIKDAMIREYSIRAAMLETGEDRQTIVDMIGAMESMDQEAVLDLTSGAPTTLADGLEAYLESLGEDTDYSGQDVIDALHALLTYPWPEEEATIATHGANARVGLRVEPTEDGTTIWVGGQRVIEVHRGSAGIEGLANVQATAESVHRAVLARVIGDRNHVIQLSYTEAEELMEWLEASDRNGSWTSAGNHAYAPGRVTVDAVEGGGIAVRTRPFVHVTPPGSRD